MAGSELRTFRYGPSHRFWSAAGQRVGPGPESLRRDSNRQAGDVLRVRGEDGNGHAPEQLRRGARTGGSGLRLPPVSHPGRLPPVLSLWPGQRKRVSQQPHRVGSRRPYPAGFQVTHGALAQVGPRCELFLREAGSMPERSQERTDRAIRRRGAGPLLHLCYLTGSPGSLVMTL
jgi:hypothetical protein